MSAYCPVVEILYQGNVWYRPLDNFPIWNMVLQKSYSHPEKTEKRGPTF
jgi:hypothetical protein